MVRTSRNFPAYSLVLEFIYQLIILSKNLKHQNLKAFHTNKRSWKLTRAEYSFLQEVSITVPVGVKDKSSFLYSSEPSHESPQYQTPECWLESSQYQITFSTQVASHSTMCTELLTLKNKDACGSGERFKKPNKQGIPMEIHVRMQQPAEIAEHLWNRSLWR